MFIPLSPKPSVQALLLAAAFLAAFNSSSSMGAVYRCALSDGSLLFTQFSCPPQTTHLPDADTAGADTAGTDRGILSIVNSTALSKAERQALQALEANLSSERQRRQQQLKRRARIRAKQQARARTECIEARAALDRLADTRRKGYSATREQQLETEEAHWQQLRKSTC